MLAPVCDWRAGSANRWQGNRVDVSDCTTTLHSTIKVHTIVGHAIWSSAVMFRCRSSCKLQGWTTEQSDQAKMPVKLVARKVISNCADEGAWQDDDVLDEGPKREQCFRE